MFAYKFGRRVDGAWRCPAWLAVILVLPLAALCAAPAQAQWTNVDNIYWTRQFDCANPRSCTLFQDTFYAYDGEQVVIHFNPYDAGWWDRWDVDVYVQSSAARFQQRRHNNASKERIFFFDISRSRDFTFAVDLLPNASNPRGSFEVRVEINSQNPDQRRRDMPNATPEPRYTLDRNDRVRGTITDYNREDRYEFYAERGDSVTIAMDGRSGLDAYLELLDSRGSRVASNDDGGSGRNALINDYRVERSGDFVIVARAYNHASTGGYTLTLTVERARIQRSGIVVDYDCSLFDAIEAANRDRSVGGCAAGRGADTITLTRDIRLRGELPTIRSDITIQGGGAEISGDGRYRLFVIERGASLSLVNMTLRDGWSPDDGSLNLVGDGGAILNEGSLWLRDCTVRNNTAGEDGGAIRNLGSLEIVNGSFIDNTARRQGGAIYSSDGSAEGSDSARLEISGTSFRGNRATRHAGAIFADGWTRILSGVLSHNHADISGGALYNLGTAEIYGSEFVNNSSQKNGGAVFNDYEAAITISSSEFRGNSTRDGGGGVMSYGRARADIEQSTFSGNSASRGGGVMVKGFSRQGRVYYGEMHLSDSRLSNNRGGDCGIGDYGDLIQSGWNDIGDGGCRRV